jgi:uncharacterized protein (DUF305 family)
MRNRHLLWPCAVLAAATLLVGPTFAAQPASDPGAAQIETDFLMGMVPHHRSAVAMAQMATDKATHQELRDMAQGIIDDQDREIAQMTQWLHDWYGLDAPAGTSMPMAGMQAMMPMMRGRMPDMDMAMQELQSKSGSDFETAFLSAMSHHHAMAIMMTGLVLMGGHHADLFTLAENIAASQAQEIRQMDDWLESWYGIDRPLDGPMMATTMPIPTTTSMPMTMPMATSTPVPMDMGH